MIKMAGPTNSVALVLLAMSLCICLVACTSTPQNNYPPGSLACKTYNMTWMDCSNRDLLVVPLLDQNSTTTLDLSHNLLKNITGAPFEKIHVLLMLDLSDNEISWMSSTSFRGLQSLQVLNLHGNHLIDLAKGIFTDLVSLIVLNVGKNWFTAIPGEILTPLLSLEVLGLASFYLSVIDLKFSGFQNLVNLDYLYIDGLHMGTNISSDIFQPLGNLPLRKFMFGCCPEVHGAHLFSRDMFAPLNNIIFLDIDFKVIPALKSLHSPLQRLTVRPTTTADGFKPELIDNTSFQVLQNFNTSLNSLSLPLIVLKRIEDYTFEYLPNLLTLDLSNNQISHLAKEAFYGLKSLLKLDLSRNFLTEIPSDAFKAFDRYASLQCLDLHSNKVGEMIIQDAVSVVPPTLTDLNLEISNCGSYRRINLTGSQKHLKHLTLSCSCSMKPYCGIHIESYLYTQLLSLQKLQISRFSAVGFEKPLCSLFPFLQVISITIYEHIDYEFSLFQAVQGCSHLKELDLSGILQNTDLVAFACHNITLSNLEILKLEFNELTSVNQVFVIGALKLRSL